MTQVPKSITLASALIVVLGSCASRTPPQPASTHVVLAPQQTALAQVAPLPVLPVDQMSSQAPRIQEFRAADEDLRLVLREIAEGFGLDYRLAPEVSGRVSVRLQHATLEEALRAIVLPHGFEYRLQDRVLVVGPPALSSRLFTLDYVALSRVGHSSTVIQRRLGATGIQGAAGQVGMQAFGGGSDVVSSTSIADLWQEIRVALEAMVFGSGPLHDAFTTMGDTLIVTPGGTTTMATPGGGGGLGVFGGAGATAMSRTDGAGRMLVINPMAGTILVQGSARTLAEVETFLRAFEASVQRQVLIEAKIVEVQLKRGYEFGVDWTAVQRLGRVNLRLGTAPAAGGLQFTLDGGAHQITAVLNSLSEQGDVRVLSSPQVSALNNQRAIFNVTTDEIIFTVTRQPVIGPTGGTVGFMNDIQTNQIAVGIVLDVFPQIAADNTVSMNIRPAITNVARIESIRTEDGSEARAPVIDRREIDTFARVRPGETIVIGGLMQTRRERRRTGVPLLRDVPLLGHLFSRTSDHESRGELIIFITPTIVSGQMRDGG